MEGVKGAQGPITGNKGEVDSLWRFDVGVGIFLQWTNIKTNRQQKKTVHETQVK